MLEDGKPAEIVLEDYMFSDANPSLILTTHYERFLRRRTPDHTSMFCSRGILLVDSKGDSTTSYKVWMLKETGLGIKPDGLFDTGLQNPWHSRPHHWAHCQWRTCIATSLCHLPCLAWMSMGINGIGETKEASMALACSLERGDYPKPWPCCHIKNKVWTKSLMQRENPIKHGLMLHKLHNEGPKFKKSWLKSFFEEKSLVWTSKFIF